MASKEMRISNSGSSRGMIWNVVLKVVETRVSERVIKESIMPWHETQALNKEHMVTLQGAWCMPVRRLLNLLLIIQSGPSAPESMRARAWWRTLLASWIKQSTKMDLIDGESRLVSSITYISVREDEGGRVVSHTSTRDVGCEVSMELGLRLGHQGIVWIA